MPSLAMVNPSSVATGTPGIWFEDFGLLEMQDSQNSLVQPCIGSGGSGVWRSGCKDVALVTTAPTTIPLQGVKDRRALSRGTQDQGQEGDSSALLSTSTSLVKQRPL